jgi:hypothetical protein
MVVRAFQVTGGVLILWLAFFFLGRILVHIPAQIDPSELAGRVFSNP